MPIWISAPYIMSTSSHHYYYYYNDIFNTENTSFILKHTLNFIPSLLVGLHITFSYLSIQSFTPTLTTFALLLKSFNKNCKTLAALCTK